MAKRQTLDSSNTQISSAEFLAGGAGKPVPVAAAVPTPEPEPASEPELPGTVGRPYLTPLPLTPGPAVAPEPPTNAPVTDIAPAGRDPFILLDQWSLGVAPNLTKRTLRAMEAPGGCLVRLSASVNGLLVESMCFVPETTVREGRLVSTLKDKQPGE